MPDLPDPEDHDFFTELADDLEHVEFAPGGAIPTGHATVEMQAGETIIPLPKGS